MPLFPASVRSITYIEFSIVLFDCVIHTFSVIFMYQGNFNIPQERPVIFDICSTLHNQFDGLVVMTK